MYVVYVCVCVCVYIYTHIYNIYVCVINILSILERNPTPISYEKRSGYYIKQENPAIYWLQ